MDYLFGPYGPDPMFMLGQTFGFLGIGLLPILSFLFLFPFVQALYANNKKKWLEKQFANTPSSGESEDNFRNSLLKAAEPSQAHPIYKIFKYYFASIGIGAIIIGFLLLVLPDVEPDLNVLEFIPLLVGGGLYYLYHAAFKGQGLYREIAAVAGFIGFTSTALIAFGNHEMYEWLRPDILVFIILSVGGFIIWQTQSTLASYVYMIIVAVAGSAFNGWTLGFVLEDNWLNFLPHLLWVFGVAILYIWIPRLKAVKDIGPREIIFGLLFAGMILNLTLSQFSAVGLLFPAWAVVLPGLYIFSKAYFYKSENLIGKPVEVLIIAMVILMAVTLSTEMGITFAGYSIALFEGFSFEKFIAYLVLFGLSAGTWWLYTDELNDSSEEINPWIVSFPILTFVIAYILGEHFGHHVMTLLLLGLGYYYVHKGVEIRDSIRVALGTTIFVSTLILKIADFLPESFLNEGPKKEALGLLMMFFGSIYLGSVLYLRSKWNVTGNGYPNE